MSRGTLILAVLAGALCAAWYFARERSSAGPAADYVPAHPRETVLDLLTRLDQAEVVADEEYRPANKVWGDRFVNTDDEYARLLVLPSMALVFRGLPVHAGATLHYGYGPNKVLFDGARGRVRFQVVLEREGQQRVLHEAVVDPAKDSSRRRGLIDLSAWAGQRVDLHFVTQAMDAEVSQWPSWSQMCLRSEGRPATAEDGRMAVSVNAGSLLDLIAEGTVEREHPGLPLRRISLLPGGRDEGEGPVLRAAPPSRVCIPVEVPADGASLRFSVGLDPRAPHLWSPTRFRILAGEQVLFEERCDPPPEDLAGGRVSARVDLSPWAGSRVTLCLQTERETEGETAPQRTEEGVNPDTPREGAAGGQAGSPDTDTMPTDTMPTDTAPPAPALWIQPELVVQRTGSRSPSSAEAPNVLLLLVDTLRADRLGCYGCLRQTSPELDQVAAQSVRFTQAVSQSSWTLPSTASLFTSQYPLGHGVVSEHLTYLRDDFHTLAERLFDARFSTAAFVGNLLVSRESNFDQGFETYQSLSWANARKLNRRLLDWIDSRQGDRFFAYVHYVDPHDPYCAPDADAEHFATPGNSFAGLDDKQTLEELARRLGGVADWESPHLEEAAQHLLDRYDSEIHYWDRCFGQLVRDLKERGLWEKTVVVLTADHGEEFFEHRRYYHTQQLYQESIHVPLIVHDPRRPPAAPEQPVEVLDLKPTLLALLGLPADPEDRGQDLFAERDIAGVYSSTELGAEHGHEGHVVRHSVRAGPWKLIDTPTLQRSELYDLRSDPGEQRDRSKDEAERVQAMKRNLMSWVERSVRPDLKGQAGFDPAALEQIRALGYLDSARDPAAPQDGPEEPPR